MGVTDAVIIALALIASTLFAHLDRFESVQRVLDVVLGVRDE